MTRAARNGACAVALVLASPHVAAEAVTSWGGHAKLTGDAVQYREDDLAALYGADRALGQQLDLRFNLEHRAGSWDVVIHDELLETGGDTVATRRNLVAVGALPPGAVTFLPEDSRRLMDLTDTIHDADRSVAVHRLDRLNIGWDAGPAHFRLGRQALSWGNGLAFHPLDFVNPFPPIAIDKDYKTAEDMLLVQGAAPDHALEAQALVLARRDPATHDVEREEGTMATKIHARAGEMDVDVILARHYDEPVFGVGLSRALGQAVGRFDLAYTNISGAGVSWSLVANVDRSWTWGGRNVYGWAEYYRNGVGETNGQGMAAPNPALAARLARGEVFALGRDYLAAGAQIEFAPLWNGLGSVIRNLNDSSHLVQIRGMHDWSQDVQLQAGVQFPIGARGTEYGGLPVPGTTAYRGLGVSVYFRMARYF